jgi:hypothetical protein
LYKIEKQILKYFHSADASPTPQNPTTSKRRAKMNTAIFEHFPLLPLELQQLIWRYALPLFPRIVTVRPFISPQEPAESSSEPIYKPPKWTITARNILTLLSINRDRGKNSYASIASLSTPSVPDP